MAFTDLDYGSMTIEEIRESYGMFTREGAQEVSELVKAMLALPVTTTDKELYEKLRHGMKTISKVGHGEVYDTEVRECIIGAIEKATKRELSIFEV